MSLCAVVGLPLPPPPARPCPSGSPAFLFLVASLVAFIAAHARPACAFCSSLRCPCLAAPYPHPLSRYFSPPHLLSAVTLWFLSVHCRAFTLVCHPCVLTMPLSIVPTLFPDIVSHPHPALSVVLLSPILVLCLRFPSLSPSGTPWVHGEGGGGFTCGLIRGPAPGRVRQWIVGIRRP